MCSKSANCTTGNMYRVQGFSTRTQPQDEPHIYDKPLRRIVRRMGCTCFLRVLTWGMLDHLMCPVSSLWGCIPHSLFFVSWNVGQMVKLVKSAKGYLRSFLSIFSVLSCFPGCQEKVFWFGFSPPVVSHHIFYFSERLDKWSNWINRTKLGRLWWFVSWASSLSMRKITLWCARRWRRRNLASLRICGWQAKYSDTMSFIACL